jgi:pyrroloquinoline quinone (PQQ) biosynthesis protein C
VTDGSERGSEAFAEVKVLAARLFAEGPIEEHPLLAALGRGELSIDQERALALQIYHVVDHFPRLLAALLANLPDWRRRTPVVENLWEEHGRGKEARVHVETYKEFLEAMGVGSDALAASRAGVPALAYNRAVLDLCLHHHYAEGLGALGVIEEIVARASPIVARSAAARHGVDGRDSVHFADHEVLDVTHADELYQLAATELAAHRAEVERGMALGYYYHCRLYSDLLREVRRSAPAA